MFLGEIVISKLSEAKVLGGIGAILMLIGGFVPYVGPIASIVGLVLVFIAVKSISQITKNKDIFRIKTSTSPIININHECY